MASGSMLDRNVALALRIADAAGDGCAQTNAQCVVDLCEVGPRRAELTDRANAETRLISCFDHPTQHRINPIDGSRAAA